MSQVSSWVRSELIASAPCRSLISGRPPRRARSSVLRTASSVRSSGTGRPSRAISSRLFTLCTCQPWSVSQLGGVRTVGLVIGQRFDVDVQTEPLPHPLPALRVAVGVHAEHLDGDPTARRAQRGEHLEEPVLSVARQVGQQALGEPRGRLGAVESGGRQRRRPVVAQVHRDRAPAGRGNRAVRLQDVRSCTPAPWAGRSRRPRCRPANPAGRPASPARRPG